MSTVIALEKFKIRVCQGVSGGTKTLFWAIFAYFLRFLAAVKQLYKPVCPSVRRSIGPSRYLMLNNFTYQCLFDFNEVSLGAYLPLLLRKKFWPRPHPLSRGLKTRPKMTKTGITSKIFVRLTQIWYQLIGIVIVHLLLRKNFDPDHTLSAGD